MISLEKKVVTSFNLDEGMVKIDNNEQVLLRKKLVSPDLIKNNFVNCSKLNSSNNTNNILKKLGFNSPKLNSYFKILNDSVRKNSIKTVFAEYVKKQKVNSKNTNKKNLNTSNPSKNNPVTTSKIISSNNNRNTASLKCGLSKNLTDQSNKLFIELTNSEIKYNGPKKEDTKQLKEELIFDNFKSQKKIINISPKNSSIKDVNCKNKETYDSSLKRDKDKIKLFEHCNTSKPVAFKNLQKSIKNKVEKS